jgi:hypothetical protein
MASKGQPLETALKQLTEAIERYRRRDPGDRLPFLAVAKGFEIAVEYGWRELKRRVESEGQEVLSPKDAVRKAARQGTIDDPKAWLEAIDARNDSVHDYFSIPESKFVKLAQGFADLAAPLVKPPR